MSIPNRFSTAECQLEQVRDPEGITEVAGTEMKKYRKFGKNVRPLGLKDAIFGVNQSGEDEHKERSEEAYVELIQFLDEKSLSLISH